MFPGFESLPLRQKIELEKLNRHVGGVAQLGERFVRNEEVSGSIPLISTNMRGASAGKPPTFSPQRPLA